MKFRVEIERPILPPNHVPGAPLPERVAVEVSEYFVEALSRDHVLDQFRTAQAAGLEHLKGRRIRCIEELEHNGTVFNRRSVKQ